MKLNKLFFGVLSVILLAGFASCGDDNDDEKKTVTAETIVGIWQLDDLDKKATTNNAAVNNIVNEAYDDYYDKSTDIAVYIFRADGTFTEQYTGEEDFNGTYKIEKGKVTIYDEDGEVNFSCPVYFKDGKLCFYFTFLYNGATLDELINEVFYEVSEVVTKALEIKKIQPNSVKVDRLEIEAEFHKVK